MIRSVISLATVLISCTGAAEPTRVATWNIANFWHVEGEYLRPEAGGGPGQTRSAADYQAIPSLAHDLNADIVGLQEMGSPEAARRAFPEATYELVFSRRFEQDLQADPNKLADPKKRDIYTALALRKDKVKVIRTEPISELAITDREGHPVRDGTAALVEAGGRRFWAVSLHLKSGCARIEDPMSYRNPSRPQTEEACEMLVRQIPILERWIDARERAGEDFVLMGDFNRVFDRANEPLWRDLDDRDPQTLDLFMVPYRQALVCSGHSPEPDRSIDYVVLNKRLWAWAEPSDSPKLDVPGKNVSDHCPVFLDLRLP